MAVSFGLILPNRAVILGAVTVRDLFDLTEQGEASGAFDTIWVGDSLLAKPRLESVTLLSALAAITTRVRLGVGCMATFAHRHPVLLAQQWASLDVLSHGRAWLVVCLGGPNEAGAAQALEHMAMGIHARERIGRLEEGIVILRKLFHDQQVSHHGRFYQFDGVTLQPSPVQNPCPIWIASNPTGLTWKGGASASEAVIERSFRRVARYADGWMTNKVTPEQFHQLKSRPNNSINNGTVLPPWRARRGGMLRGSGMPSITTSISMRTDTQHWWRVRPSSIRITPPISAPRSSRDGRPPAVHSGASRSCKPTSTLACSMCPCVWPPGINAAS
jgi:luciferase-like monooxygenase